MSKNCIRCVANKRTGLDLLCDACRVAEAAKVTMNREWVSVQERLPTHIYSVVIWITGSPIHMGQDYLDTGIYNAARGKWQTSMGDYDADVEVSHWMNPGLPPGKQP